MQIFYCFPLPRNSHFAGRSGTGKGTKAISVSLNEWFWQCITSNIFWCYTWLVLLPSPFFVICLINYLPYAAYFLSLSLYESLCIIYCRTWMRIVISFYGPYLCVLIWKWKLSRGSWMIMAHLIMEYKVLCVGIFGKLKWALIVGIELQTFQVPRMIFDYRHRNC